MGTQKKSPTRSSAAEYLTFVAATGDNPQSSEMRYEDENIWLTQKMIATLYDIEITTVNKHISEIYKDSELSPESTIRKFRIVKTVGSRQVECDVEHYCLQMVLSVGFKVNSPRAVQFRKWIYGIAKDYTIQGWVMDEERLKKGGTVLTKEYFEKLIQKIREIRISERRFYQKITDLYSTALDYDKDSATTKDFFTKVQNKMHYTIHRHSAAELIVKRADAEKPHMGLTSWDDAPSGKVQKYDVVVAQNYLSEDELQSFGRIVSVYLDFAENMAIRQIPMTMEDWAKKLDIFLNATESDVLTDADKISDAIANAHAESEFAKYRIVQDRLFESDFDKLIGEN